MQSGSQVSLRTWIWRAFVQTALIPLILVETVLISVYLISNASIRDAQISHLRETTLSDLQAAASQAGAAGRGVERLQQGKPITAEGLAAERKASGSWDTSAPEGAQSTLLDAYNDLVSTSNRLR